MQVKRLAKLFHIINNNNQQILESQWRNYMTDENRKQN